MRGENDPNSGVIELKKRPIYAGFLRHFWGGKVFVPELPKTGFYYSTRHYKIELRAMMIAHGRNYEKRQNGRLY